MKENRQVKQLDKVFLVVDRHKIVRDVVCKLLSNTLSVEVLEAKNGLEALKILEQNKTVELVVTDVQLPLINGIELTKIIQDEYPKVKVIALSMLDDVNVIQEMTDSGVDAYVLKEGNVDELLLAIDLVRRGEVYFSDHIINVIQDRSLKLRSPDFNSSMKEFED